MRMRGMCWLRAWGNISAKFFLPCFLLVHISGLAFGDEVEDILKLDTPHKLLDSESKEIYARADQLRYGAVYYWKVCAIASDGFEKPSEPRSFRLMP